MLATAKVDSGQTTLVLEVFIFYSGVFIDVFRFQSEIAAPKVAVVFGNIVNFRVKDHTLIVEFHLAEQSEIQRVKLNNSILEGNPETFVIAGVVAACKFASRIELNSCFEHGEL